MEYRTREIWQRMHQRDSINTNLLFAWYTPLPKYYRRKRINEETKVTWAKRQRNMNEAYSWTEGAEAWLQLRCWEANIKWLQIHSRIATVRPNIQSSVQSYVNLTRARAHTQFIYLVCRPNPVTTQWCRNNVLFSCLSVEPVSLDLSTLMRIQVPSHHLTTYVL